MTHRIFIFFFVLGVLAACASQGKHQAAQPAWILGHGEQYPKSQYLLGVGEADTLAGAKSRARAEIAKIFNVTIDASSVDTASFASRTADQTTTAEEALNIESEIQARTRQLLEGVDIAEAWRHDATRRYYALATLPRLKTAMSLRAEIERLDAATRAQVEGARAETSLLRKIRLSGEAIDLQLRRQSLDRQLRVVAIAGEGMAPEWSVDQLRLDRAALRSRVSIRALARGSQADKMQQALANVLANQGFRVSTEADYTLTATLDATALPPQGAWFYQKATLSVSLTGENQASLGGYEWNYKVSSTESVLTDLRVIEKAKALLESELDDKLFELMEFED